MPQNVHWALALLSLAFIAICTSFPDASERAELMQRWNESMARTSRSLPQGGTTDFHWSQFERFPHPTFNGGTPAAYQGFAAVLLHFLGDAENFEFLKRTGLLAVRLVYRFPSGQTGLDTSFEELSKKFSAPNDLSGYISTDARCKIESMYKMIHATLLIDKAL